MTGKTEPDANRHKLNHPASRWQFSLRELLFLTAVAALYLAAFATLHRYTEHHHPAEIRVFWMTVLSGFCILIALSLGLLIERRRAGRTLVKLSSRWWGVQNQPIHFMHCGPAVVLGTFAVRHLWLETDLSVGTCAGLSMFLGYCAGFSAVAFLRPAPRLCEFGLLHEGLGFQPWSRLRGKQWCLDDAHRLTIGKGWRKWTFAVPPEQRAIAEALLLHKLGTPSQ